MDFDSLSLLRRSHPAWRLLAADHAPLLATFVSRVYLLPNVRTLPEGDAVASLDDLLFEIRDTGEAAVFPRSAREYIEDWAADSRGWLRRYYSQGEDEPFVDVTPAAEKAVRFLSSLGEGEFVGTESRLLTIFALLRQIASGTEEDAQARLRELMLERARIDEEIARVRGGDFELMDDVRVKDRFLQMRALAQELLADFRQVEENFRSLYREVCERVTTWEEGKGALLAEVLGDRDAISDSEQGNSFRAFWDFLMSRQRQQELSELLEKVLGLSAIKELDVDPRLRKVHYDWLEAGDGAQRTVARLSAQLRHFVDDRAWQEDRRILKIIRQVEQRALAVRSQPPPGEFFAIDHRRPTLSLPFERPLYAAKREVRLTADPILAGVSESVAADALFEQRYVDVERLQDNIQSALGEKEQISLRQLVALFPIEHGLAELVTYFGLASKSPRAHIDDDATEELAWVDERGTKRVATSPRVIFSR